MRFPISRVVSSENETTEVALKFSEGLFGDEIILLNGELGSGKTFFVKAVCSNYGIINISSPSFAIVNEYHNLKKVIHFDFYRIKKIEELYDLGIEDYMNSADSIIFIEWANLFPEILPKQNYQVDFKILSSSTREITIRKNG